LTSKKDTVSVAFRSKETGRYLFWVKWTKDEWDKIEWAASERNQSVEDFILEALRGYTYDR
jgi:uncharacterized protein (DUF1778 family)